MVYQFKVAISQGLGTLRNLILLVLMASCANKVHIISDTFDASPVPPMPNYSDAVYWAALPEKLDSADCIPRNSHLSDGQADALADVFFVHPTIFTGKPQNQYHWNADVNDGLLNQKIQNSTIINQATIFNGSCRVYAPYYRQAHLYSFYTKNKADGLRSLELAYSDVKAAFEYYLKNYNNGRPIVIASHSQGSFHCERLLKDYFDGQDLQHQLVVAYLVGRAISPTAFANIMPTKLANETGVWASWNTWARGYRPADYEKYFKNSLSTNPLLWNSSTEFAPKDLNAGGVGRHFTFVPQLVDAQNHEGLLWVNKPYVKGRWLIRTRRWHRADMNFFWMNIRENVALRIDNHLQRIKTTPLKQH
jgi:hypothetical protein